MHLLRIDASARTASSDSRQLGDAFVEALDAANTTVTQRDADGSIPVINEDWISANFTPNADRTAEQHAALTYSNDRVAELQAADTVLITTPIYNFGVPAALKAWVDMVARAGLTFSYGENGPVGLLENKRAVIIATSGGTAIGSEIDFATPYLKHVLGFIGIHDVRVIGASGLAGSADPSAAIAVARDEVSALARQL